MMYSARVMNGSVAVGHVRRSNACSVVFVLLASACFYVSSSFFVRKHPLFSLSGNCTYLLRRNEIWFRSVEIDALRILRDPLQQWCKRSRSVDVWCWQRVGTKYAALELICTYFKYSGGRSEWRIMARTCWVEFYELVRISGYTLLIIIEAKIDGHAKPKTSSPSS